MRKSEKRIISLCITVLFSLSFTVHAGSGDEEKKVVISSMRTANEATISLQAKMKQRKQSSFMDKEIVTKADFYYQKPGKYALNPSSEAENQYIVNNNSIWIINRKNKTVTTTSDNEINFSQYLLGFGNSLEMLEKYFDVQVDTKQVQKKFGSYKLTLVPKRGSKFYDKMESVIIYVRDDLWLPYQAELSEADGDKTIWEFSDFRLNHSINSDVFKQETPKGFQVKNLEKK
ncbi:MAG TPA: outer-membrane lipoprotein carrier protein LolA [bacterium]|nr:outer-membrane lipoprotein carrier protein LolA [bacterium]HMW34112.1 outer-membrane lipoprotein carrier protein LolA [bacterium]HMW35909.1 outer-membrane lipoprotein carrier protein LolA [bacterium]HMY35667.1 outer-membrane lipoprotein carrier protein LolA [bacterium]HMZ03455.1 outer-membrane lipoprotein carrier protein LolA [bacterium]